MNNKKLLDGVGFLEVRHNQDCPAVGSGIGCNCEPELHFVDEKQFLQDVLRTIADLKDARNKANEIIKKAKEKL